MWNVWNDLPESELFRPLVPPTGMIRFTITTKAQQNGINITSCNKGNKGTFERTLTTSKYPRLSKLDYTNGKSYFSPNGVGKTDPTKGVLVFYTYEAIEYKNDDPSDELSRIATAMVNAIHDFYRNCDTKNLDWSTECPDGLQVTVEYFEPVKNLSAKIKKSFNCDDFKKNRYSMYHPRHSQIPSQPPSPIAEKQRGNQNQTPSPIPTPSPIQTPPVGDTMMPTISSVGNDVTAKKPIDEQPIPTPSPARSNLNLTVPEGTFAADKSYIISIIEGYSNEPMYSAVPSS